MSKIGFIGSGNMAEAIIKGIISSGICKPKHIYISDINKERLAFVEKEYGVTSLDSNDLLAERSDILILSIKPQQMQQALEGIKAHVRKDALVISIAAGVRVAKIADLLGDIPIVRVMPNTPALVGEGASALFANLKGQAKLNIALEIFSSIGLAVIVDNEDLIDAVTAVSGSGPAYYFLLMEEMIKAGMALGLSEDTAKKLVLQTAKGAAILAAQADKKGEGPAVLRQKVTSPGGTTQAAIKVMTDCKFGEIVNEALNCACRRSKELSQ